MGKTRKSEVVRALSRLIGQCGINEAQCREKRRIVEADAWNIVAAMLRFEVEQVACYGPRFQPTLVEVPPPF